jgi:group I intron endonuclease
MIGIYAIKNNITKFMYVGSSKNIESRWKRHQHDLACGTHHNTHLQRAWNKYGSAAFEWEVLQECNIEFLLEQEQKLLDSENNLYNIGKVARGGDNLSNHPNKSEINKRKKETLKLYFSQLSNDERRAKMGRAGEQNGMYGKSHSEETKKKISVNGKDKRRQNAKKRKGKTNQEIFGEEKALEISNKLSELGKERTGKRNPFYGKSHSKKTKQLLSEQAKKRFKNMSNEQRKAHKQIRLVCIDNKIYYGVTEAARQLNVSPGTICYRISSNNEKYQGYNYVE